eukprot:5575553-Alexandrium_andersonii.AAC.1
MPRAASPSCSLPGLMPRSRRLASLSASIARASWRCWAKCFLYSSGMSSGGSVSQRKSSVSYTHLTLPTICSV